ncbi:MAG: ABC transporter [Candidatus Levybacteria bacterium RIFCSPLOWO2_02_FULL_37_10]|nr:MAG: ABC transporter [Candidatus Levybacteria bacterium RIFCSPHIGHO2_01_FULL_37_33]OGH15775.1 MAG: ABC transporter [Candidatus Levybacteria bacterium RIFCSPHIGHO2_02_FULL_37_11]OGH29647.1 MAG: ABC transporter [Candidatus Levybacteria bacterium RIFCSPHIGHO2_12_FULL_37_12]OGH32574.1 MAG: ABC transporter [Candidatus Levybacteria bacterium RIFCSPLOWO2_01_FULL_36_54]OGH43190.1 MAG: ABC transporter [Candidatus Levybacteria bacterium RIFCSPLOWO2_02_FULL_37_10]
MTISVSHLSKHFQVHQKEPGVIGSLKSLVLRKYETVKAVSDISFKINEGELIGFIGPNGAGKTTTLKCLSGLLYPTNGKISVLGFNPYDRKIEFLKKIALVMGQKNQLWWDLPPIDTFLLNKEIYGIENEKYNIVFEELTKLLDAKDILKVPVKKLSLGQRMKMELMASIIHSPKVLFLDEPTIGLDVLMQKKLREFLKEYNIRFKATIILTSHYMADVEQLCKRVIIINFGKIIFDGQLSNLIEQYAPYKKLSVIFREYVDPKKLDKLGNISNFQYPKLIINVPNKKINSTASSILKNFPVEDITIEDPQIEDIIEKVYTQEDKRKK